MAMKMMKVCFIGADGSGKTSIILRYTKNTFTNSYLPTIGCDFYEQTFKRGEDKLQLFVWDIASQKTFERMRHYYLAYTDVTVICIDSQRHTPEFIEPWISDVKTYVSEGAMYMFAITKSDLLQTPEELEALKNHLQQTYAKPIIATSAKTGENVSDLFNMIADELWKKKPV
jgi:small GTP-binding protein